MNKRLDGVKSEVQNNNRTEMRVVSSTVAYTGPDCGSRHWRNHWSPRWDGILEIRVGKKLGSFIGTEGSGQRMGEELRESQVFGESVKCLELRSLLWAILGSQLRALIICSQEVDPWEKREREKKILNQGIVARNQRMWYIVPDLRLANCVILGISCCIPESVSSASE